MLLADCIYCYMIIDNNMANNTKILICGGAGYIGGYLTDLLIEKGYNITVYDNLTYEDHFLKNVPFIFGDIRDYKKLGKIINDFDIVIWLAAVVGDSACAINEAFTKEVNVQSVKWLVNNYKGKIIYTSTCSVYGMNNNLLDESSEVNPLSHYALTKLEAEQEIVKHSPKHLIFRLGTLFGVGDKYSRLRFDLAANALTKRAALNELMLVFGGGQWRPLLHVKDVAEAIAFGIENNINGLYNLSHKNYKICDIAEVIKNIVPHSKLEYGNVKFEDLRDYKVVSDKFKAHGWQPKYSLEDGIKEIYQVIIDGRIKEPNNIIYSNVDYLKNKVL